MQVFWQKGYEGASLADLTKAMGINRPSMYAAFGDKAALFKRALDRYASGPASFMSQALKEKNARAVAEKIMRGTVGLVAGSKTPPGCFMIQAGLTGGDDSAPVCRELTTHRELGIALIRKRLKRAKAEGDLPRSADPAALARYIATVIHGIAVQAASGASRKELEKVVDLAMQAWPQ